MEQIEERRIEATGCNLNSKDKIIIELSQQCKCCALRAAFATRYEEQVRVKGMR